MKLKDFVRQAIEDIVTAVIEARDSLGTTGAEICPPLKTDLARLAEAGKEISHRGLPVRELEFDIAITVSKEATTHGDIGVGISVLGLKSGGKSHKADEQESRVRFSIPLTFPLDHPKKVS